MKGWHTCLGTLLLLFSLQSGLSAGIEAGAAALEITPETGLKMAGYSSRKEGSAGVMNPLFVRVLVLKSGERSVAIAVFDLIGVFETPIREELTRRIRIETGIDEVIYSVIHAHAGPQLVSAENIESLPRFERDICEKTVQAIKNARANLEPVSLGVGYGSVDISYNRIKAMPDGGVDMIWENHKKEPLGPTEKTVFVLRLDDMQGRCKALLVNYACHPVILGSDNLLYSPDFPGAMCRNVEQTHADRPLCIFVNGACGDMNPYFADENEIPAARVQEVGLELAREVLAVAGSISTGQDSSANAVTWKKTIFPAGGRWDVDAMNSAAGDEESRNRVAKLCARMQNIELPISLLLITPEIGFVGLPGEFFSRFQSMLREKAPLKHLIVAGYTNGGFSYFPTVEAAVLGGYGANDEATLVRPGTGEHCVIEAVVGFYELLGKLRAVPSTGEAGYQK